LLIYEGIASRPSVPIHISAARITGSGAAGVQVLGHPEPDLAQEGRPGAKGAHGAQRTA